ncbi:hypothetical protein [Nocardia flavorosea]|uniref:hypothetical protein n=1 Tax=Nocardia flavorosea TaxID=53429 RepID=UPI002457F5C5|nr:hypothetical protein [Nocardia flavorosea]
MAVDLRYGRELHKALELLARSGRTGFPSERGGDWVTFTELRIYHILRRMDELRRMGRPDC